MTALEILKQAERIVSDLIAERTPPLLETCQGVLNDLSEMVAYARKSRAWDDDITPQFAREMNQVVDRLSPFRAPAVATLKEAEKVSLEAFVEHFKNEIEMALKDTDRGSSLARLHALREGIVEASKADTEGELTIRYYQDPWQQAKLMYQDGKVVTTAGTAGKDEVKVPGGGIDLSDLVTKSFKAVRDAREKADSIDVGWTNDLASPRFLRGEAPRVDFGRDGLKK